MDPVELGNMAASGWRAKVADALADPLSRVAPVKPEQARAIVGATFFLLSVVYVVQTSRRAARQMRAGR